VDTHPEVTEFNCHPVVFPAAGQGTTIIEAECGSSRFSTTDHGRTPTLTSLDR
jgi:hypothetical protein